MEYSKFARFFHMQAASHMPDPVEKGLEKVKNQESNGHGYFFS